MFKKIGLHIGGRRFDVDVEQDFSIYLENMMSRDFNIDGNNELKTVLQAYIKQTHELYILEKKMQKILDKLN